MLCRKIILILLVGSFGSLFGQDGIAGSDGQTIDERRVLRDARDAYELGDYKTAKRNFLKLIKLKPTDPIYNFEIGRSFFESPYEKREALKYMENALKYSVGDTIPDIYYFLGRSNHLANNFDKAIANYNKYINIIETNFDNLVKSDAKRLISEVKRYIEMSNYAKKLVASPVDVSIVRLDDKVNSPVYPDYAPVISADENILIFTSKREGTTGGKRDKRTGEYFEDVYMSRKIDWTWTKPLKFESEGTTEALPEVNTFSKAVQIELPLNTEGHDAVLALSTDGQTLFLYRKENVYVSELDGLKWKLPTKLSSTVNFSRGRQPSLCISPDGNTIYFASNNKKDSYGGLDIYKSVKGEDGEWGKPVNLGPEINTPYDEDSPFLHPDGKTLYFSSNGHQSMGGYDIFRSVMLGEGKWGEIENLGYPVNTSGDDTHFVINAKGDHAYYASVRELNGSLQSMDIYMLLFEGVSVPVTQIKGLVTAGDDYLPIAAAITITDKDGNKIMAVNSNSSTGEYSLIIPPNNTYTLTVAADGFEPYSKEIFIPDQKSFYKLYQEINLSTIYSGDIKVGQQVSIQNAFFDINEILASDSALYNKLLEKVKEEQEVITGNQLQVQGLILGADDLRPLDAAITITDKDGKVINALTAEDTKGSYFLELPPNNTYQIHIAADGHLPYTQTIEVPDAEKFCLITQDLKLAPIGSDEVIDQKIDVEKALNCDPKRDLTDEQLIAKKFEEDEKLRDGLYGAFFDQLNENDELAQEVLASKTYQENKEEVDFEKKVDVEILVSNDSLADLLNVPESAIDSILTQNPSDLISMIEEDEDTVAAPIDEVDVPAVTFDNILFEFDSYALEEGAKKLLNKVVEAMNKSKSSSVQLTARTDSRGTPSYNLALSSRRSKAAYNYLVSKGINKSRISRKNLGEQSPVAPNENPDGSDNPDGRKLNRSVEVVFSNLNINSAY